MGFFSGLIIGAIFSSAIFGVIEYIKLQASDPANYSALIDKAVEYAPQLVEKVQ